MESNEALRIVKEQLSEATLSHTDGTGGLGDTPHELPRAAAVVTGLAQASAKSTSEAKVSALASRVPGRHTNQRAEVQALLLRLQEGQRAISWGIDYLTKLEGPGSPFQQLGASLPCSGRRGVRPERPLPLERPEREQRGRSKTRRKSNRCGRLDLQRIGRPFGRNNLGLTITQFFEE